MKFEKRTVVVPLRSTLTISNAARMHRVNRASNVLLLLIVTAFVALGLWAGWAEVDTVAQATGKVIPSARVHMIQSLEGGVVSEIHVVAGQTVEAGALLVSLSPTQADGDLRARRQQTLALAARIARLRAEAEGLAPNFKALLSNGGAEFVRVEQAAYDLRRAEQATLAGVLAAQIAQKSLEQDEARVGVQTAQRSLATVNEELAMVDTLVARGLEPRIELVRLQRVVSDLEGRQSAGAVAVDRLQHAITETKARRDNSVQAFVAQVRDELNRALGDLRSLESGLPPLEERVGRTGLRTPVRGVVNRVFVNSLGGVAKPGEPLVELVPAEDQLVVETMVNPRDIGFIQTGQTARVKLTAYDYSIFGAMPGKVIQVGADAITNERGESYYLVRVQTDKDAVESLERKLPIISGMQAQVDIVTGSKTVMTYLLKPLIAVRESAFRER